MSNLSAEMARFGVSVYNVQAVLDCSEKTARNKVNGSTEFTVAEAMKLRDAYFPGLRLEYLFASTD